MNIVALGFLILIAFILQYLLTYIQIQSFHKYYRKMRQKGRVVIGRKKGAFRAGAIVMFAIDDKQKVIDGAVMQGVTVLARFHRYDAFNGLNVATINEGDCKALGLSKSLTSAILDGVVTFKTVSNGDEVPMPPSPFIKIYRKLKFNS
ncbi:transcriptional regulator GutM [Gemella sp. zg-1178]|uniref:transcriptional regulator GutM n=1 Tax=Gemella sp. zg-1178 TaxID=2840372 RepID=UPI001C05B0F4|nr:transcriptional regulator GutM [Gemella sp. zg-1178]MBU0278234.1 transcriptional regulator GutM [Gemella sp. zg-1178]